MHMEIFDLFALTMYCYAKDVLQNLFLYCVHFAFTSKKNEELTHSNLLFIYVSGLKDF